MKLFNVLHNSQPPSVTCVTPTWGTNDQFSCILVVEDIGQERLF